MASVTKESKGGKARYRVWFNDSDGRRKSIRLLSLSKRDAESIARKIESIVSAQISGEPLPRAIADWIANVGDELRNKLADAGLCSPRKVAPPLTVIEWMDREISRRKESVAERSFLNWKATRDKLEEHFGGKSIASVTPEDADRFAVAMRQRFAGATAAGHIKRAKQFFRAAVRARVLPQSPFAEVKAGAMVNAERLQYVSIENVERVIAVAPDHEWRLLIALSRYGGLRSPSETLNLKWGDVDWDAQTMRVASPKTAKQGKPFRIVPIFASLRPYLQDAWDAAPDGAVFCIERYRSQDVNLRTHFQRLIERAGVKSWPRLWHNLRASCETDLTDKFPLHVAAAWLGNTPKVAEKHYLSVKPEHVAAAVALNRVVQGVVQNPSKTDEIGNQRETPIVPNQREIPLFPTVLTCEEYTLLDSNQ
jgi:integrase